jgi:hypothetical protein
MSSDSRKSLLRMVVFFRFVGSNYVDSGSISTWNLFERMFQKMEACSRSFQPWSPTSIDRRPPSFQFITTARDLFVDVDCCSTVCVAFDSHGLLICPEEIQSPVLRVFVVFDSCLRVHDLFKRLFDVTCEFFRQSHNEVYSSKILTPMSFFCVSLFVV